MASCHLTKEVKEVILRVLEFCKEEKYNRRPIIPLKKANLRVATATGVSLHTVTNITREGKIAALNGTKIGMVEKRRKQRCDKITFSKFDLELIKDILLDYYKEHKEWPLLKTLLPLLRKQIGYTNSIETLRRNLRHMGIVYEKAGHNKWIIQPSSIPEINPSDFLQVDYEKQDISHDHDYSKR